MTRAAAARARVALRRWLRSRGYVGDSGDFDIASLDTLRRLVSQRGRDPLAIEAEALRARSGR